MNRFNYALRMTIGSLNPLQNVSSQMSLRDIQNKLVTLILTSVVIYFVAATVVSWINPTMTLSAVLLNSWYLLSIIMIDGMMIMIVAAKLLASSLSRLYEAEKEANYYRNLYDGLEISEDNEDDDYEEQEDGESLAESSSKK